MKSQKQKKIEQANLAKLKADHRKMFLANVRKFCNLMMGYDVYAYFSQKFINNIYEIRFYNIKIEAKVKGDFSPSELEVLNKYLKQILETRNYKINDKEDFMPLGIVLVEGMSLIMASNRLVDEDFPKAAEVKSFFEVIMQKTDFVVNLWARFTDELHLLGVFFSHLEDGLIFFKFEYTLLKSVVKLKYLVLAEIEKPPIKQFVVDGNARPAMKVGFGYSVEELRYAKIKSSLMGIAGSQKDDQEEYLDIYVQKHALNRLKERLGLNECLMHYCLHFSFVDIKYHWNNHGMLLVNYTYLTSHMGYLVCSIQDGCVLVQSFLFLTFNGTPEGNRLNQLTGLNKIDKKYLAIDNFKSFLSHNLDENEYVKDIFVKAGCGQLLELKFKDTFEGLKDSTVMDAELISKYLTDTAQIPVYEVLIK